MVKSFWASIFYVDMSWYVHISVEYPTVIYMIYILCTHLGANDSIISSSCCCKFRHRNQGEMSPSHWEGPRLSRSWIHLPNSYEPLVWLVFKSYDSSHSHPQADCYVLQYFAYIWWLHHFPPKVIEKTIIKQWPRASWSGEVPWRILHLGFDHCGDIVIWPRPGDAGSQSEASILQCWRVDTNHLVKLGMVYEVYGAICHIFPNPICWSKIWCLPPKWSQILQRELGRSSSIAGAFAKCWALVAFLFEGAHDPRVTNIEPHFRLLPNRTFPTK